MLYELLTQLPDLFSNPVAVRDPRALEAVEGHVDSDAGSIRVRVAIGAGFPFRQPEVRLLEEGLPEAPPIMPSGSLCWQDPTGMAVDHKAPLQSLRYCLQRVRQLLDHALHERPWDEIMAEYESYWSFGTTEGWVVVGTPGSAVTTLRAVQGSLVCDPEGKDGLVVPVGRGQLPLPPVEELLPWVKKHLMPLVSHENRQVIARVLGPNPDEFRRVVFKVPRSNGLDVLLGMRIRGGRSGRHPLRGADRKATAQRAYAYPWDMKRFRDRGGAYQELGSKRVMVVGCGAVGGHVVMELVRAGCGGLTLVDPDRIAPENGYRHALGVLPTLLLGKSQLLKAEVDTRYPGAVEVEAIVERVEDVLGGMDLGRFDAAVVAVDRPAAAQAVNKALYEESVPVVHAWLEAFGVASHVLRVEPPIPGCFECLLRDPRSGDLRENRSNLAGSGQDFTRDQAGCGGRYVPFGSLHASRTANLAVEQTVALLRGRGEPVLSTWRGDFADFLDAGYQVSARAHDWPAGSQVQCLSSVEVAVSTCPVCAS